MKKLTVVIFLLASLSLSLLAQDSISLVPKWPIGKRVITQMKMNNMTQTKIPQMPTPQKQTMIQEQQYAVSFLKKSPEGGVVMESEILSVKMGMNMGHMSMAFDSTNDKDTAKNNPLSFMRNIVGKKITIITDANNKAVKIEGFDAIIDTMPPNPMMKTMFNEEAMKKMAGYEFFSAGLANKKVKVGDSWNYAVELPTPIGGKQKIDLKYTFTGMENHLDRKCAVLKFSGSISMSTDKKKNPMGISMKVKDGKMSGTNWMDPDLGIIIDGVVNQNMTMEMEMPSRAPGTKAQSINTILNSKVTTTVTKVEDIGK